MFRECIDVYTTYSENGKIITLQEFQSFLIQEQGDPMGNDEREVSRFMRDYLQDSQRNVQEPFFTTIEVRMCDYLSSMHRSKFIKLGTQSKYKRLKAGSK
jgi:phosphatidylinositol phospholipase C gamma-1